MSLQANTFACVGPFLCVYALSSVGQRQQFRGRLLLLHSVAVLLLDCFPHVLYRFIYLCTFKSSERNWETHGRLFIVGNINIRVAFYQLALIDFSTEILRFLHFS